MDSSQGSSALERLRFGAARTLNLRSRLPTAPEAAARVESWLRSRQVELEGEVLVITGRGRNSIGGVPVVREATRRVLVRLRRAGVVQGFVEDTAGSFVVALAPLRALFDAPRRRGTPASQLSGKPPSIRGLRAETASQLRHLSALALDSLGVSAPTDAVLEMEMQRQFSLLARALPPSADVERWFERAIVRAIREHEDGK